MGEMQATGSFEETRLYQAKYSSLLSICNKEGTMILQDRVLERDKDIAPHRFFRKGTREYVFPQQKTSLLKDNSHFIDKDPAYELRTEEQTFSFDEDLVEGKIRIEYQDSGNCPILKVIDLLRNSKIPEVVRKELEAAFRKR